MKTAVLLVTFYLLLVTGIHVTWYLQPSTPGFSRDLVTFYLLLVTGSPGLILNSGDPAPHILSLEGPSAGNGVALVRVVIGGNINI